MSSCLFSELRLQECFSAAQTRKPPWPQSLLPHFSLLHHHHHCWILCLCGVTKKWKEPQLRRPPPPPPSGSLLGSVVLPQEWFLIRCLFLVSREMAVVKALPLLCQWLSGRPCCCQSAHVKVRFLFECVCECVCVVCLCQLHWKCHPWQTECLHDVHTVGSVREECFTRRNQNCWSTVFVHDASTAVDTDRKPTVSPHENDHIQHFTHTHTH